MSGRTERGDGARCVLWIALWYIKIVPVSPEHAESARTAAVTDAQELAAQVRRSLATPEGRRDPYPLYRRLREVAPVAWADPGIWLVTGYEAARSVLRDPRFERGYDRTQGLLRPDGQGRPATVLGSATLLNLDGPAHTRVRRLVSRSFQFSSSDVLQPPLEAITTELLDRFEEAGGGDLVETFCEPLPRRVIAVRLGVPPSQAATFDEHARAVTAVLEMDVTPEELAKADRAATALEGFFSELLDLRRRRPEHDLLSSLAKVEDRHRGVVAAQVTALAIQLFAAGLDNVANQIGNAVVGLLSEPWQTELLRHRSGRCIGLPDELFRHDPAVQLTVRTAAQQVRVGGVTIGAGDTVVVLLGAANRDPHRYPNPDHLDLQRTDARPLSFGGGVHHCVGFHLARAEVETALRGLFGRFAVVEALRPASFRDRLSVRGPSSLVVRVAASGGRRAAPVRRTGTLSSQAGAGPGQRPADELDARPGGGEDHSWRSAYRATLEASPRPGGAERDDLVDLFSRVRFFAGCTREELAELVSTAYPIAFEAGEAICSEGTSSGECWIIAEGVAHVSIGGDVVARIHADSVVGERGLLLNRPRSATVTADDHVIAYAVSRDRLVSLVNASPTARQGMLADLRLRYGDDLEGDS